MSSLCEQGDGPAGLTHGLPTQAVTHQVQIPQRNAALRKQRRQAGAHHRAHSHRVLGRRVVGRVKLDEVHLEGGGEGLPVHQDGVHLTVVGRAPAHGKLRLEGTVGQGREPVGEHLEGVVAVQDGRRRGNDRTVDGRAGDVGLLGVAGKEDELDALGDFVEGCRVIVAQTAGTGSQLGLGMQRKKNDMQSEIFYL